VRARAPEGEFLALVRADSLRLAGGRFTLVGEIAVDARFLARLAPDSDLVVSIVLPGAEPPLDSVGTVVGELRYPFLDAELGLPATASGGTARIVIQRSFALPRQVTDPCRAARDLLPAWPSMVAPLVDTRGRAVVRRGVSGWVVDWDGTVRLALP